MASTITVSWSEIDTFRQCPLKHQLAYKERWQKPAEEGTALSRGSLGHQVLEQHYKVIQETGGEYPQVIFDHDGLGMWTTDARINSLLSLGDARSDQTEEQDLIAWIYAGYVERYGNDPDWEIVAVEYANEFWLPASTREGSRSRFKLKVKLDLIVRYKPTGQLWIDDHKFNKDIPSDKMLELDDQFGLYTWGLKQLGMPVVGCIYNCLRTQRNKSKPQSLDERFKRIMLYRTDEELAIIALEAYATAKRAWSRGPLDDSIAPGTDAERNPNSDTCRWRCPFTEDCLGGRKGYDMRRSLKLHGFEQNFERH